MASRRRLPAPGPVDRPLDPAEVEAVLRRAIELAPRYAYADAAPAGERLPVSVLHEVAEELSVPASAVSHARAELEASGPGAGLPALRGRPTVADRLFGPGTVATVHHSPLPADVTLDQARRWLDRGHHLRIHHASASTVVAVRRRGALAALSRNLRSATGHAGLSSVREVRAAAVNDQAGRSSSLCLVADVRQHRTQSVLAGTAVAAGTTAVVTVTAIATAPVALVGLPAAIGTGWLVSRLGHRQRVNHLQEEVEITAAQIAAGVGPPSLVGELAARFDDRLGRLGARLAPGPARPAP